MRDAGRDGPSWAATGAAVALALVVAEVAALALSPGEEVIAVADVPVAGYFRAADVARAEAFRDPQRLIGLAALAVELALLALLVVRPPAVLRRTFARPVLAGALTAAALSLLTALATLPLSALARSRAIDVGLVTRSWPGWASDVVRGQAIAAVLATLGAAIGLVLVRRLPRTWWIPAAGVVVAFGAISTFAAPVVLDPVFNRFESLPAGQTRTDVERLARRAGVAVDEVVVRDASKRTTAANAAVGGLGSTKRVILDDTLLDGEFSRDEVRIVVAHELAHQAKRDIARGLLYLALIAPFATFALALVVRRLSGEDARDAGPRTVVALAFALLVLSTSLTWVSNGLSREVEARADSEALRLTDAPDALVAFQRRLALRNVTDPDPPGWAIALLATHPSTIDRIGRAEAYRSGAR